MPFIGTAAQLKGEVMLGKRKDDDGGYGERALVRLRLVADASPAHEGADPAEVRQRLRNTMTGGSRRLYDRGNL